MKRIFFFIVLCVLVGGLCACGQEKGSNISAPSITAPPKSESSIETTSENTASKDSLSRTESGNSIEDEYSKNIVINGQCGENVTWEITEDGLLIISGNGPMFDYGTVTYGSTEIDWSLAFSPWDTNHVQTSKRDMPSINAVLIKDGVTSIGAKAFEDCYALKKVIIAESVTSIGEYAFSGCWNKEFTHITIPSGVTFIGEGAFFDCEGLVEIQLPSSITGINESTFEHCVALKTICIPKGVPSIDQGAFGTCTNLTSISIPDSVKSVGLLAFSSCESLTDIYYEGNESQWNAISVDTEGNSNTAILNATVHYNSYPQP